LDENGGALPEDFALRLDGVAVRDQGADGALLVVVFTEALVDGPKAFLDAAEGVSEVVHGVAELHFMLRRLDAVEFGLTPDGVHGEFQRGDHGVAGQPDLIERARGNEPGRRDRGAGRRGQIAARGQSRDEAGGHALGHEVRGLHDVVFDRVLVLLEEIVGKLGFFQDLVGHQESGVDVPDVVVGGHIGLEQGDALLEHDQITGGVVDLMA
jgi:hypothetical protein